MGNISNDNFINFMALSTTQPHLLLTHCDFNSHELITGSSAELCGQENNFPAAATSRWSPTPEQITTLEELYRSGTRTPTIEEIKEIASKLRKYGRIEGKNVFYWFQNHKARDRQKRRRTEAHDAIINNVPEPHDDFFKDPISSPDINQTKSCPYFPPTHHQTQNELISKNYNKDININNEDHGTTEESKRIFEDDGKDATWRNLVTFSVTQEPGEINTDENVNNVNGEVEEEEETREIRTLNLFPVMENQETIDRFKEKSNKKANVCCYYYEFMPLKN